MDIEKQLLSGNQLNHVRIKARKELGRANLLEDIESDLLIHLLQRSKEAKVISLICNKVYEYLGNEALSNLDMIDKLQKLDQTYYKTIIMSLASQSGKDDRTKLAGTLQEAGHLSILIGDYLRIISNESSIKSPLDLLRTSLIGKPSIFEKDEVYDVINEYLNNSIEISPLKYYNDAAVYYQYVNAILKDQPPSYKELREIKNKMFSLMVPDDEVAKGLANYNVQKQAAEHKKILADLREFTKHFTKAMFNENSKVKDSANILEAFFDEMSDKIKKLLANIYKQAEQELGKAPCEYAILGLGSMAHDLLTPYSALEFAIVTENSDYENYFSNLSYLIHFKIINLGETPVQLSKYGVELSVIPNWVRFDPNGHTPLGGGYINSYGLTGTITDFVDYAYNKGIVILKHSLSAGRSSSLASNYSRAIENEYIRIENAKDNKKDHWVVERENNLERERNEPLKLKQRKVLLDEIKKQIASDLQKVSQSKPGKTATNDKANVAIIDKYAGVLPANNSFYTGDNMIKLWELYLKHIDSGIKFYHGTDNKDHPAILSNTLDYSAKQARSAIVVNSAGDLYKNYSGFSISICSEISHFTKPESVNSTQCVVSAAILQIKEYNKHHSKRYDEPITDHMIIFPFRPNPMHWNLGVLELFIVNNVVKRIVVDLYEPLLNIFMDDKFMEIIEQLPDLKKTLVQPGIACNPARVPIKVQQKDFVSGGVITAENGKEFLKARSDGIDLVRVIYNDGTESLRTKHAIEVCNNSTDATQLDSMLCKLTQPENAFLYIHTPVLGSYISPYEVQAVGDNSHE